MDVIANDIIILRYDVWYKADFYNFLTINK